MSRSRAVLGLLAIGLLCLVVALALRSRPEAPQRPVQRDVSAPEANAANPENVWLQGRVLLETGTPGTLPMPSEPAPPWGCRLRVWRDRSLLAAGPGCGADGTFGLALPPSSGGAAVAIEIEVGGRLRALLETEAPAVGTGLLPAVALGVAESVRGHVVDGWGEPLAGIELHAMPEPNLGERQPWRAYSDAQGAFAFDTLPPGPVVIRSAQAGYAPSVAEAIAPQEEVLLVVSRLAELRGRVVGPPDLLARTVVRVEGSGVWPALEHSVEEDGAFEFRSIPDGVYALEAVALTEHGLAYASVPVEDVNPASRVTLALSPAQRLAVRVIDPQGRAVENARVSAANAQLGMLRRVGRTDAKGEAELGPCVPGTYVVRADADGWLPADAQLVEVEAVPPEPLTLRLVEAAFIEGRVVDEGGHGVAGASVRLQGEALYVTGASEARAQMFRATLQGGGTLGVTQGPVPAILDDAAYRPGAHAIAADGSGHFRVSGLMPGTYTVEAWHPEYADSGEISVSLGAGGGKRGVEIVLRSGTWVRGIVRDGNRRPIAGAQVRIADGREFRSDARGEFGIPGAGKRVVAVVRAEGFSPERVEHRVSEASPDLEVILQPATGSIGGRVLDENRRPIERAWVQLQLLDGLSPTQNVHTDARGVWQLQGLPAGAAEIEAGHGDYATAQTGVKIQAERTTEVEIVLDVGWTLEVWVTEAGRGAVAGAQVHVGASMRRTDENGHATFPYLHARSVAVEVSAEGLRAGSTVVSRPARGGVAQAHVELAEGGRVEGRTSDYRGDAVGGAHVRLRDGAGRVIAEQRSSGSGAFAFDGVPPGEVTIEATPPASRAEELAEVAHPSDVLAGRVTRDVDVRFDRR